MYTKAIVKEPGRSIVDGITEANMGRPDYKRAIEQHRAYNEALKACGLNVIQLDPDENFPDSVFIEDTAVVSEDFAIVSNPSPASRKNESFAVKGVLAQQFKTIHQIETPGTLEGGDVMKTDNHFFVGITGRTNKEGAIQFKEIVEQYGYTASFVFVKNLLHLKTGISYLEDNTLLLSNRFSSYREFDNYKKIILDDKDEYAANSLWINGKILIPDGFPEAREKVEKHGFETISMHMGDFRKLDGGLSCLSLRF